MGADSDMVASSRMPIIRESREVFSHSWMRLSKPTSARSTVSHIPCGKRGKFVSRKRHVSYAVCRTCVGYCCEFVNMWTSDHTGIHRKDSMSSTAVCNTSTPWSQVRRRCFGMKAACLETHKVAEDMDKKCMKGVATNRSFQRWCP